MPAWETFPMNFVKFQLLTKTKIFHSNPKKVPSKVVRPRSSSEAEARVTSVRALTSQSLHPADLSEGPTSGPPSVRTGPHSRLRWPRSTSGAWGGRSRSVSVLAVVLPLDPVLVIVWGKRLGNEDLWVLIQLCQPLLSLLPPFLHCQLNSLMNILTVTPVEFLQHVDDLCLERGLQALVGMQNLAARSRRSSNRSFNLSSKLLHLALHHHPDVQPHGVARFLFHDSREWIALNIQSRVDGGTHTSAAATQLKSIEMLNENWIAIVSNRQRPHVTDKAQICVKIFCCCISVHCFNYSIISKL